MKDSSKILHALVAKVELKKTDQSVPYVPLPDIEPELVPYEAAMSPRYRTCERGLC